MGCSISGPQRSRVQHWLIYLLAGWVFQPARLPPAPGLGSSGVGMLLYVRCTYSHPVHLVKCHAGGVLRIQLRDSFWSFSPMGRRLSQQIASSTRDVWSWDHYSAVTTTANAERSPGHYCIRLERFPGSDCKEYENVETEFILSFNIISQKASTGDGISRGKSFYKTNGFLLSLCQQMINSWCWRCIWVT